MVTATTRGRIALIGGGSVGIGLAALVDVVVFHHILQTHHLLSNIYDPGTHAGLQRNVYYDGLFSLGSLVVMLLGGVAVWWAVNGSRSRLSTGAVLGAILIGMGLFNTYDGIVDHYVLGIHDAVHGTTVWNPPWVVGSLVLLGVGAWLLHRSRHDR